MKKPDEKAFVHGNFMIAVHFDRNVLVAIFGRSNLEEKLDFNDAG